MINPILIDLLEYITQRYPDATKCARITKNGSWHSIRAVWRGDKVASCGIKWYGDRWRFSDYATGQHGDVVDFLMQVEGYDKAEAMQIATGGKGLSNPVQVSARKPAEPEVEQPLVSVSDRTRHFANQSVRELRRDGVPRVWSKRGFTAADCAKLKLGRNGEDGVFPIMRGKQLVNLKIRLANAERGKYRYAEPGHGSPAWYSPNIETAQVIIVTEGELNGMAISISMPAKFGVIAMAGASQPVTNADLEVINGRPVYVIADDDQAGRDAALRWCYQCRSSAVGVMRPLGKQDACDVLGGYGKIALRTQMVKRILEVDNCKPSGRDGAVRSWLSRAESVRDRSVDVGINHNAARLTALPTLVANGLYLLCIETPELIPITMRLGKNVGFAMHLAAKHGHVTAQMLADFAGLQLSRSHEILDELAGDGLFQLSTEGRTKVAKAVNQVKKVLGSLVSKARAIFKERQARYLAAYRLDRDIFWQWVETTVQGWKWLGVHSGIIRLST